MISTEASFSGVTEESIYQAIADVLDPELDEPLLKLGFIDRIEVTGPDVLITFKLPTFWCSPNFAYLMAADLHKSARTVAGVRQVQVLLLDHCAEEEVTAGVNAGHSFAEAFPGETTEDEHLEELRRIFLRKGFLQRQDTLLRQLLKLGLDEETMAALCVRDLYVDEPLDAAVVTARGQEYRLGRAGRSASLYQQRRVTLGLPCTPGDPLIVDDQGKPLQVGELQQFLRRSRSIRMNIVLNTTLCKGLFHTRYGRNSAPDDED